MCNLLDSIDKQILANCFRCLGQYPELYKPGEPAKSVYDSTIECNKPPSQDDYIPIPIPDYTSSTFTMIGTNSVGPSPTLPPFTKDQCNKYCEYLLVELDKSTDITQKCAVLGSPNEQYVENCLICVESYPELADPSKSGRQVQDQLEQCELPTPGGPYEEIPLPSEASHVSTGSKTSSSSGSFPTDGSLPPQNKCSLYCLYIKRQLELSPVMEQCKILTTIEEQIIANCFRCQEIYEPVAVSEPVQSVNEAFEQCNIDPSDKPYSEIDIVTKPGQPTEVVSSVSLTRGFTTLTRSAGQGYTSGTLRSTSTQGDSPVLPTNQPTQSPGSGSGGNGSGPGSDGSGNNGSGDNGSGPGTGNNGSGPGSDGSGNNGSGLGSDGSGNNGSVDNGSGPGPDGSDNNGSDNSNNTGSGQGSNGSGDGSSGNGNTSSSSGDGSSNGSEEGLGLGPSNGPDGSGSQFGSGNSGFGSGTGDNNSGLGNGIGSVNQPGSDGFEIEQTNGVQRISMNFMLNWTILLVIACVFI